MPPECLEPGCREEASSAGRCNRHHARRVYWLDPERARKKQREYLQRQRHRDKDLSLPKIKRQGKKKIRICLKCDKKFPSWGIANRFCDSCRQSNEKIDASLVTRGKQRWISKPTGSLLAGQGTAL